MKIQDVINMLSHLISALTEIKMQKVRGEITEAEALTKAGEALKKNMKDNFIEKTIDQWKQRGTSA